MAIAIHSAKILSGTIIKNCSEGINPERRKLLAQNYQQDWSAEFAFRLKTGRAIQNLFGHNFLTQMAITGLKMFPSLAQQIVKKTHGQPF
jgi:flavin-dependent dehydrogenase